MKFLLVTSMLFASVFANANVDEGWAVKCFERNNGNYDLAYIIKVNHDNAEATNRNYALLDCTYDMNGDKNCQERGYLKKIERQDESCLVLMNNVPTVDDSRWALCHQHQETLRPRLVPVSVHDDRQESRVYCERSILRIL